MSMVDVYIPFYTENEMIFEVPLESLIVIFVSQWRKLERNSVESHRRPECKFIFVKVSISGEVTRFVLPKLALEELSFRTLLEEDLKPLVKRCVLPAVLTCEQLLCVAGLGGVLRYLLKNSSSEKCQKLLGFRKGCLMACAEFSVWTRYCEVDLLNCTKLFVRNSLKEKIFTVPVDVSRFETHLNEPIRIHNIGKKKYDIAKNLQKSNTRCQELITVDGSNCSNVCLEYEKSISKEADLGEEDHIQPGNLADRTIQHKCFRLPKDTKALPDPPHVYAEEMAMTLSDLIIFVCIMHILNRLPANWDHLRTILPAVTKWYVRLLDDPDVTLASKTCGIPDVLLMQEKNTSVDSHITVPSVLQQSLYIRDPKRYNSRHKMYTKQNEVDAVVDKLKMLKITPSYQSLPNFPSDALDWSLFPEVVHPTYGNLPKTRLSRKCQQLENMALSLCNLVIDGDVIVDFCSGGGHLGILLAHLLPKCQIILVENKEESVNRALIRASKFPNMSIYQCNLDYFQGKFDIGVALHACGMATDLVIQCSLKARASFVVCPCCYGGLRDTHLISYPRSQPFQDAGLSLEEYYFLGHAADQTHENGHKNDQGKYCMGLVDTDRSLQAKSFGYKVKLYTMNPVSCTPKNNIIIGVTLDRHQMLKFDW